MGDGANLVPAHRSGSAEDAVLGELVRFGSLADIGTRPRDDRFAPKAKHRRLVH